MLTELSPEIGNLTQLRGLWLADNSLANLPAEIGQLRELAYLDLSNNQLTHLPTELGNLIRLGQIQPVCDDFQNCVAPYLAIVGNPLVSHPEAIIQQGTNAILSYLQPQPQITSVPTTSQTTRNTESPSSESSSNLGTASRNSTVRLVVRIIIMIVSGGAATLIARIKGNKQSED